MVNREWSGLGRPPGAGTIHDSRFTIHAVQALHAVQAVQALQPSIPAPPWPRPQLVVVADDGAAGVLGGAARSRRGPLLRLDPDVLARAPRRARDLSRLGVALLLDHALLLPVPGLVAH